jgi:hypothetical protein
MEGELKQNRWDDIEVEHGGHRSLSGQFVDGLWLTISFTHPS